MGSMTDANIEAFQEATGIKPARGEYADKLDELATAAFELIKVLQDERSGIRDGNGFWHGSDPPDSLVRQIGEVWEAAQASRPRGKANPSNSEGLKVADDPKTGELPSPESDSDEDGNGVGKRNKLEHYASRPLTDFLQFDGFLDCDACRWEADPETGELHEADEAA